jgi:hypothetical protein
MGRIKLAAAILKETFAHPLTTSLISVDDGNVEIQHLDDEGNLQPGDQDLASAGRDADETDVSKS